MSIIDYPLRELWAECDDMADSPPSSIRLTWLIGSMRSTCPLLPHTEGDVIHVNAQLMSGGMKVRDRFCDLCARLVCHSDPSEGFASLARLRSFDSLGMKDARQNLSHTRGMNTPGLVRPVRPVRPGRRGRVPIASWIGLTFVLIVGLAGCDSSSESPAVSTGNKEPSSSDTSSGGTPSAPLFVDGTHAAGVDFVHDPGATGRYYFPEIMGSGGAWIDIDNDGDLDLYLIQGGGVAARMIAVTGWAAVSVTWTTTATMICT